MEPSVTLPSMTEREMEKFLIDVMTEDGWKQQPVKGLQLKYCFPMIAGYIQWLREGRYETD